MERKRRHRNVNGSERSLYSIWTRCRRWRWSLVTIQSSRRPPLSVLSHCDIEKVTKQSIKGFVNYTTLAALWPSFWWQNRWHNGRILCFFFTKKCDREKWNVMSHNFKGLIFCKFNDPLSQNVTRLQRLVSAFNTKKKNIIYFAMDFSSGMSYLQIQIRHRKKDIK